MLSQDLFWAAAISIVLPLISEAQAPLTVGIITELSGPAAANGADCKRGYELAQSIAAPGGITKAGRLRIVWGDTRGDARNGVTEFSRLVDTEGAQVVLLNRSQVAMAVNPLSREKQIPLLGISGHPAFTKENPYAFRFFPPAEEEGAALARRAAAHNLKTVALLTVEDQWTLAARDGFLSELIRSGGESIYDETFHPGENDLAAPLTRIRAARPDLVVVNLGPSQAGAAIKKIREAGIAVQLFGTYFTTIPAELTAAGAAAEGLIATETNFRHPRFLAHWHKMNGELPLSGITFTCYAAFTALVEALETPQSQTGPGLDRQGIYHRLLQLTEVRLPDGPLPLVERAAQFGISYTVVAGGRIVRLEE